MYLKSIKAYGFKSFADKIEINFGPNINGIVGPNGSGKSNVVDAVRWVLGEQSIKSLRGETSTDVIFSGSKSRKPLNSASITLVFDNTDLYLPIQYTEVSVRRVMYRSGENEYYLNNEKCRLKDITNLLTDSGADKESFNIIGQGKIDEILSTRPEDRRLVFESAAGVLKYKKRKLEAIKKLERTNQNISRVNDILNELENNIYPLEKQSLNAKKYLEYKEELTDLEISLMVHDIHFYNHHTKQLKEKIDKLKDELIQLSSSHSSYDIDILEKKDQIKKMESEINLNQNALLEVIKSIEKIDADIRILKERKKYTEDSKNHSEQDVLLLKENILKLETSLNELKNDISKYQENIMIVQNQKENYQKKYQELVDKKNQLNNLLEQNQRDKTKLKYKIDYLENSIQNNQTLPSSVKNILSNKRFIGIHNVIGKLFELDDQYYTAISIALGGAANYIVVNTSSDAKEIIHYLKENKLGRATFFPIDTIKPRYIDETFLNKVKNMDGFIGIASSLVRCKEIYHNIILNQLGNVIVADNLEHANQFSKMMMHRYKIVTLDGQQVNVGGSITGGSISTTRNLIQDKYELQTKTMELESLNQKELDLEDSLKNVVTELQKYEQFIHANKTKILDITEKMNQKSNAKESLSSQKESLERELKDIISISNHNTDHELENLMNMYYSAIENRDNVETILETLKTKKVEIEQNIIETEELSKQDNYYISTKEKNLKELEIQLNTTNIRLDNLLISLGEEYNMTYEAAVSKYNLEVEEELARNRVKELKNSIKELGYVNIEAIDEYDRVKERYDFLNGQREDLKKAENTLLEIIKEMDDVMKEKFVTTFEAIRKEFKKVFREMFHGGEAELLLTDPDNILETGIEIQAVPSGKNLKSLSLLSGGEKTFTAISLLFAILNVRPVPFCLLDEVEAALDDANVESFGNYLNKYRDTTQFILITHKKKTMEFADILYGITMQESGVTKLVSVRLEDIKENN
ncbi:MAG: chromosome segregation protein SMC [Erysipelotrichaceae bacterium]|nr:chromosome segregation protein SMC [Erysipelotrichaceae bacterium]